ncbi:MAG: excinuclease ABC subunit UvrC [Bifidobacteriaceae bacterium]|jgi:excinuclease ABC subunit C|nr:excinuclease ABC subunit UvrC [Bifidobacteriaceae bacterium]MCI1915101.1 excinuclease ABC subunit UvrC [Bifidobacteriaceae bacterium]
MSNGIFERHSPGTWRKTARTLLDEQGSEQGSSQPDANSTPPIAAGPAVKAGTPRLGDTRDAFRPKSSDIPAQPGVYKWRDSSGRVIYVGKAKNLRNRLANYFQPLYLLHPRTQTMVLTARSLEWTVVATELEALTLEYTWIKEFDPRFNVVFRDDKTYPYLAVSTGEKIPRIWITRSKNRGDTKYFGPYAKVYDMRHSLDKLLKVFPVRTCTPATLHRAQLSGRPCLLYSIGKCTAPCVGHISLDDHRSLVNQLTNILTGSAGPKYVHELTAQMKQASKDLEFEKAAKLRDQIQMMGNVVQQNSVVFSDDVNADAFGLSGDELEASVHAFFVRSGTIRGERNWSVEKVEEISDAQLLAELITQVYSQISDEAAHTKSAPNPTAASMEVSTKRDAVSETQSLTATNAVERTKATRERKARELLTGRDDLFSEASPIPAEIIVPLKPEGSAKLEQWLSGLRGSKVTIHVAQRGEKRQLVERATANAELSLKQNKLRRTTDIAARTEAMNDIMRELGLPQAPLRIEGYDISNATGGGYQVASMVVFEDGVSKRSEYRRFSIRGADGLGAIDDTSAVYETLMRRFRHGNIAGDSGDSIESEKKAASAAEANANTNANTSVSASVSTSEGIVQQNTDLHHFAYKPNLIVVDGGKPQVEAAARALEDSHITDVALCGLAKKLEEVWLPGEDYPLILKRQSEGMYLLQRVRDESHRFAITYHRKKRRKGEISSVLDSIAGIGPAYGKRLLRHFGSVKKLRAASKEEIEEVKGIGAVKAETIFTALHAEESAKDASVNGATVDDASATAAQSSQRG